jgi:hypothetical protein
MRRSTLAGVALAAALSGATATVAEANSASLRGSRAQMVQQNTVAKQHGLSFYRTPADIQAGIARGDLVELTGNANYDVADFVRHPYAHPAAKLFVERLAGQYREACGQKLVVTSAVRPENGQPGNAHALSVHPAGMAIDLRVSDRATCRAWLENALMNMERRGVINGIREHHPPHYHVAVYPEQYLAYAAERAAEEPQVAAEPVAEQVEVAAAAVAVVIDEPAAAADLAPQPRSAVPLFATLAALIAVPLGRRFIRR